MAQHSQRRRAVSRQHSNTRTWQGTAQHSTARYMADMMGACERWERSEVHLEPEGVVSHQHAVVCTPENQRDVATGVGNSCDEVDPAEYRAVRGVAACLWVCIGKVPMAKCKQQ